MVHPEGTYIEGKIFCCIRRLTLEKLYFCRQNCIFIMKECLLCVTTSFFWIIKNIFTYNLIQSGDKIRHCKRLEKSLGSCKFDFLAHLNLVSSTKSSNSHFKTKSQILCQLDLTIAFACRMTLLCGGVTSSDINTPRAGTTCSQV